MFDCSVSYFQERVMNRVLSLVPAMVISSSALAVIPEGDVSPFADGGRVGTNLVSEDGLTTTANVRVFFAELGEDVPNFTQEPGWQSPDGTFAGDGLLTFQINRTSRSWAARWSWPSVRSPRSRHPPPT
jgi:hypothetical protein